MDHYRTVFLVVRSHIFQLEAFRQVIVYLNSTQLPATADSIFHHKVQFRTIECSFTVFNLGRKAFFFTSFNDSLFSLFPVFITSDILFAVHFITQRNLSFKVFKVHRLEDNGDDIHYAEEFILHLVRTAEDMSIILSKATYTGQSVQLTTLLVTAYCTEFSDSQRQIAIRTRRVLIDHTVVRTVHRFQEVFFSFFRSMNRLECVLTILRIVS